MTLSQIPIWESNICQSCTLKFCNEDNEGKYLKYKKHPRALQQSDVFFDYNNVIFI
jgi:hypothetical protein